MKIPFLGIKKKLLEAEAEIDWLLKWKLEIEKRIDAIEELMKYGETGRLTKKRMINGIRQVINTDSNRK